MGSSQNAAWWYTPDWTKFTESEDLMEANCASEAFKAGVYGVGFGAIMAAGSGWWTGLPFRENVPMMARMGGVVGMFGIVVDVSLLG